MFSLKKHKLHDPNAAMTADDRAAAASSDTDDLADGASESLFAKNDSSERTAETLVGLDDGHEGADETGAARQDGRWLRGIAFGVLPTLVLLGAGGAGYLKWSVGVEHEIHLAQAQSVQVATEGTIAMLSYRADTVETQLRAARDRLTGKLRDSYTSLTNDVVIPGAKQKNVSVQASVPSAASMSATANHAVVLVFVNQTTTVGADAPTDTASSVRVTLDRVSTRWLISDFTPV